MLLWYSRFRSPGPCTPNRHEEWQNQEESSDFKTAFYESCLEVVENIFQQAARDAFLGEARFKDWIFGSRDSGSP